MIAMLWCHAPPCRHAARTGDQRWGKQALPSSGRKSARSGLAVWPRRRTLIAAMAAVLLSADRDQRCRLAVGCLQGLVNARQIAKAGRLAKATPPWRSVPPRRSRRFAQHVKLAALRPVALPFRLEAGRINMRPLEIPHRCGCGTYRRIGGRDERPQRRRVPLQSSPRAADRADIEGRRLYRDPAAADRGQGQAQPGQARCRSQRSAGESLPVDPPQFRARQVPRRTGSSKARSDISATASAAIRSSSPAEIRTSRPASPSPNWSARK